MAQQAPYPVDDIDRHLLGEDHLTRLYQELPREDPPARMTQAVQAAARQAAEKRNRARQAQPNWLDRLFHSLRVPMVAVASGVLVVSISLRVLHEKGDDGLIQPDYDQPASPASQPATPPTASTPAGPNPAKATPPRSQAAPRPALPSAAVPATEAPLTKALPFDLKALPEPTSDEWIKLIRDLLQQGKAEEARIELRAFLKAHPHYALPADLQALHPEPAAPSAAEPQ